MKHKHDSKSVPSKMKDERNISGEKVSKEPSTVFLPTSSAGPAKLSLITSSASSHAVVRDFFASSTVSEHSSKYSREVYQGTANHFAPNDRCKDVDGTGAAWPIGFYHALGCAPFARPSAHIYS